MRKKPSLTGSFLAVAVLVACGSDDSSSASPSDDAGATSDSATDATAASTIHFEARVGDLPFSCSTLEVGMGSTHATVEPLDFRVYVHDVRLVDASGNEVPFTLTDDGKWQYHGVALLDFEDKTGSCENGTIDVNTTLVGTVPRGTYAGLKLKIGVPFELDHADVATAPSPLNLSGLFWNWNGGYKFARIDARMPTTNGSMGTDAGMDAGTDMDGGMMMDAGMAMDGGMVMDMGVFNIHLGSTECQGDRATGATVSTCGRPNVGEVVLTGFDPLTKTVLADYAALVAGTDLSQDHGGAPGCMSGSDDPDCPNVLAHLGVDPTTGKPDATKQTLFRVE